MSKFDTLALEVDKPSRMTIQHPHTNLPLRDKEGNEAYIDLHSSDSGVARKAQRMITNGRLNMRNRNKITAERLETEGTELLADLTVGWRLVGLDGELLDVPFSRQNAVELYENTAMAWLREQVDQFTADRASFSAAPSTSS